ncbi:hypothetical protein [Mitsuokella multacida]|uniref:Uncharacterized protein n=1 Tax=Mitsuokella multacida DSM 20544 TaxID=500635 RepID=C9KJC5_9FIRM|nr:hypothetical protein [Mitsuokella multacida]EEX69991.1 hypothetical protein MITSMUL_03122 [Mitsuokella multacida DSM 20544]
MKKITLYSYEELGKSAKASAYRVMAGDHNLIIKQELADCAKIICKAFDGIYWTGARFLGKQNSDINLASALATLDEMNNVELKNIIMSNLLVDLKWNQYGYSVAEWLDNAYVKYFHKYQATPECIAEYCKTCKVWFYVNGARCYDF